MVTTKGNCRQIEMPTSFSAVEMWCFSRKKWGLLLLRPGVALNRMEACNAVWRQVWHWAALFCAQHEMRCQLLPSWVSYNVAKGACIRQCQTSPLLLCRIALHFNVLCSMSIDAKKKVLMWFDHSYDNARKCHFHFHQFALRTGMPRQSMQETVYICVNILRLPSLRHLTPKLVFFLGCGTD